MSDNNSNKPFEWSSFVEQAFGKHFPFGASFPFGTANNSSLPIPDTEKLQETVRHIVERSVPQFNASSSVLGKQTWRRSPRMTGHTFQTHRSVFVRLRLPKEIKPSDIRVLASSTQLTVKRLMGKSTITSVRLPALVRASRGSARMKNSILEVRLPKAGSKSKPRELYVEW